jgi:hypothetical protein
MHIELLIAAKRMAAAAGKPGIFMYIYVANLLTNQSV